MSSKPANGAMSIKPKTKSASFTENTNLKVLKKVQKHNRVKPNAA